MGGKTRERERIRRVADVGNPSGLSLDKLLSISTFRGSLM